jgi:DNA-directed RNA polymerase specialized sigma24 family protein
MNWFYSKQRESEQQHKSRIASRREIKATFEEEGDYLFWIALLITGDATVARQSIVNASELSSSGTGVFHDWLIRWAHSATARVAVEKVREVIQASANRYPEWDCAHGDHNVFSNEEIQLLRQLEPHEIIAALDPLARSVLVLRAVQHASISECASILGLRRRCVTGAYCRALQWANQRRCSRPITGTASYSSERPIVDDCVSAWHDKMPALANEANDLPGDARCR